MQGNVSNSMWLKKQVQGSFPKELGLKSLNFNLKALGNHGKILST